MQTYGTKKRKIRHRKKSETTIQNYIIVTVSFQIKWDVHNDFSNRNLFNDHVGFFCNKTKIQTGKNYGNKKKAQKKK